MRSGRNVWLIFLAAMNIALLGFMIAGRQHAGDEGTTTGRAAISRAQSLGLLAQEAFAAEPAKAISEGTNTSSRRRSPVVLAAQKVSPSVVSVGAVQTSVRPMAPSFNDFFSPYLLYQYKERMPYLGSGVIINSDGYILTNYHVIEGGEDLFVTLTDGREFKAKLLDADRLVDIALLKIEGKNLPEAKLGDSDSILIGEWVMAIGNPFGNLIESATPTVTLGVVSAVNRNFNPEPGRYRIYQDMIQTDAAINPGNSGGPLVNLDGEVVGINTFILSSSGSSAGVGFSIPINRARAVVKEIMEHGKIRPLWVDFDTMNITPYLQKMMELPTTQGALVSSMEKTGPGIRAGMRVGDVITKADDHVVRNYQDLLNYFLSKQVGEKIKFEILREGKQVEAVYQIEEGQ
ncbi:MAG: trypsin-like peptidase domain-containing protein [bacterium]